MFTFYSIHVDIRTKFSIANNESESLTNPPGGLNSEESLTNPPAGPSSEGVLIHI